MEITGFWGFFLAGLYDTAVLLMIVGSAVLLYRQRSWIAALMLLAFAIHLGGNLAMRRAYSSFSEARQAQADATPSERDFHIARVFSAVGLFAGACGFVLVSLRRTRARG